MANIQGTLETAELIRRMEMRIYEAVDDALDHVATVGEKHAKRLAPVRKVSEITRRRGPLRALSKAEVASLPASIRRGAQAIMRGGGSYYTTGRRSEQSVEAPGVRSVEDLRTGVSYKLTDESKTSFLTGRGRRELAESGRRPRMIADLTTGKMGMVDPKTSAIFTRKTSELDRFGKPVERATLGGRLRGEIRAEKKNTRRGVFRYDIVSPTPYARYVEFPTSRTAAQPYMRPTLKFLKRPLIAAVYRELKRRGFRPEPI